MTHDDNAKAMHEDAAATAAEMLEAAGAKNIRITSKLAEPGMAIHELGTARMGNDPKTSVTDPCCQLHDVKNVFAMDGACFVSSGCQNPTLTMMALTVRACDHLIDRFKHSDI
jgi:choline dehydrogenase-like flavoprotein